MIRVFPGDCREVLAGLEAESVHCVVTSPPYWGLRDYGVDGQIGLEPTPDAWAARLVEVFREVRRVLRPDGVCFVNVGDSYAGSWGAQGRTNGHNSPISASQIKAHPHKASNTGSIPPGSGLKPKDLIGQPWLLAFALRADGWYLRSEIIWAKPNPMPESVTDRPTKAHEQVFLLTKSSRYFWDAEAVREAGNPASEERYRYRFGGAKNEHLTATERDGPGTRTHPIGDREFHGTRNARSVWTIATEPFSGSHFAVFPSELVRRCILAGTSAKGCCPACGAPWARVVEPASGGTIGRSWHPHENDAETGNNRPWTETGDNRRPGCTYRPGQTLGWRPSCSCTPSMVGLDPRRDYNGLKLEPIPCTVLDHFGGSGTTGVVADQLGRDAILIDLSPEYAAMAERRIVKERARRMLGEVERVAPLPGQLALW